MIKFRCGACGQKLGVPDDYAGRLVKCTGCATPVRVPGEIAQKPAAPSAPTDDQFAGLNDFEPTDDFETIDEPDELGGSGELMVLEEDDDADDVDDLTLIAEDEGDDPFAGLNDFNTDTSGEEKEADEQQWQQPGTAQAGEEPQGESLGDAFQGASGGSSAEPRSGATQSDKLWMLKAAHLSFWSAIATIPLICCAPVALSFGGMSSVGSLVGYVGLIAPFVAVVSGIIGIAGAKHFPGQGALWRAITGTIVGAALAAVFLTAMALKLVVSTASSQDENLPAESNQDSGWNQSTPASPDNESQDALDDAGSGHAGVYTGKWALMDDAYSGTLTLAGDGSYRLTIESQGNVTEEAGKWKLTSDEEFIRLSPSAVEGATENPPSYDLVIHGDALYEARGLMELSRPATEPEAVDDEDAFPADDEPADE